MAGLTLPQLSAFDPPVAGEGSLDPMGLAALSDRLADRLVPGVRARMARVRFVTATAVGALAWEELIDEPPGDDISTPPICFEWIMIEGFVRRLPATTGLNIPGTMKARAVINRNERLSAATYLKGPAVFGFNGVYKPFSVDARVVDGSLLPAERCADLVRRWEVEQGYEGYADAVPGTTGGRLRGHVTGAIRATLRDGRCTVGPRDWLFGRLVTALHPDEAKGEERRYLRSLLTDDQHPERAELTRLLLEVDGDLSEAASISAVRPRSSAELGAIIDAVIAYEELALRLTALFHALRFQSYAFGVKPITAASAAEHPVVVQCAAELPSSFTLAADRMAMIGADGGLEQRLGDFALPRSGPELVDVTMAHHEKIQASKVPNGKRPWFEEYEGGWVIRPGFGTDQPPTIGEEFVHPIRVAALVGFIEDTA